VTGGAAALRLAHRGDWRGAPENSLAALAAALANPACDGLEFDVRLGRDGVPVVLHDETLTRVQRRPGRVSDLAAAELAAIPRLEDALAAAGPDPFLDIELKGDGHGTATASVLRAGRGDEPSRAVVSAFEPPTLMVMRELLPAWPRWLNAVDLSARTLALASTLGCAGVSVMWAAITPRALRATTDAGLVVAAWTVRLPSTFERLARLGVVACCVEGAALDG